MKPCIYCTDITMLYLCIRQIVYFLFLVVSGSVRKCIDGLEPSGHLRVNENGIQLQIIQTS